MTTNGKITWTNSKRLLSQLIPWPNNPRQIKGEQVRRLQESFEEFGQPDVIAIGPDNELYNGHQRLKAWSKKFGDIEIDVRVSSRPLTEQERKKLTVFLHKGATGEEDWDMMANLYDVEELLDWGYKESELKIDVKEQDYYYFDKPELEIGPELLERHDYLVFYFDNELDWNVATEALGVETVLGDQVGKKTLQNKGIGRVLPAAVLLELLAR